MAAEQLSRSNTNTALPEGESASTDGVQHEEASTKHSIPLKTCIFAAPASHGLLYSTTNVRILSGYIENFLARHVDERLSPGWQLRHLSTSGKWDVKNLKKWQAVAPCSDPIAETFRAMKTMREVDDEHSPPAFVKKYSWKVIPNGVAMVVDISLDAPVYDKAGLENGDVEYHKFPTVSKQPPGADEVEQFIALIDTLRQSPKLQDAEEGVPRPTIGVHCHYGFNRTGENQNSPIIAPITLSLTMYRVFDHLLPRGTTRVGPRRRSGRILKETGTRCQARSLCQRAVYKIQGWEARKERNYHSLKYSSRSRIAKQYHCFYPVGFYYSPALQPKVCGTSLKELGIHCSSRMHSTSVSSFLSYKSSNATYMLPTLSEPSTGSVPSLLLKWPTSSCMIFPVESPVAVGQATL